MCRNPCLTSFGPLSLWKKVKQQRTLIVPAEQRSSRCPGKEEEEGGRSKVTAVLDLPPCFSLLWGQQLRLMHCRKQPSHSFCTQVSACWTWRTFLYIFRMLQKIKIKEKNKQKTAAPAITSRFSPQRRFSWWTCRRHRSQLCPLTARKTRPWGRCSQSTEGRGWTPQCPAREERQKEAV